MTAGAAEITVDGLPGALTAACVVLLAVAGVSALVLVVDVVRRPPDMAIMRIVWPLTALYAGVFAILLRVASRRTPRRWGIAVVTTHCGAGCTLGDLVAEWLLFALPGVAVVSGWPWLFPDRMPAIWIIDTVLAVLFGIAFQYASIVPMQHLGVRAGLAAAAKADLASIAAWQVGMVGTTALVQWVGAPVWFGGALSVATPEFWVAMQVAMVAGFALALPVNAGLVRAGVKEAMA